MSLTTHRSIPSVGLDSHTVDVLVRFVSALAVLATVGAVGLLLHGTLLGVLVAGWVAIAGATASLFGAQRLAVAFLER